MKLTTDKAKEMPLTSAGLLAMHKLGIPVRSIVSQPTYSKHRAILKAHGFDIHDEVVAIEKQHR